MTLTVGIRRSCLASASNSSASPTRSGSRSFTLGSIAFYFEALFTLGVTLFLIGSVELGTRPAIRFARESSSAGSLMDYLTRWPDF